MSSTSHRKASNLSIEAAQAAASSAARAEGQSKGSGLHHSLGLFDYFSMGFSAIVGTGWLMLLGDWIITGGGPIPAIIAFLLGAFLLVPFAWIYAELSAAIPVSGGIVDYVDMAFGHIPSFLVGWFMMLGNLIIVPWEALAIATYISTIWGSMPQMSWLNVLHYTVLGTRINVIPSLIASLIALGLAALHLGGTKLSAKLSQTIVWILIATVIAIAGIALFHGSIDNLMPAFHQVSASESGSAAGESTGVTSFWAGVLAVLAITPSFYTGFETIPQSVEEAKDDLNWKRYSWPMVGSILGAATFYIIALFAFSSLGPWSGFIATKLPVVATFKTLVSWLSIPLLIVATLSPVGPLNSFFSAVAHLIFEMGRRSQIPHVFARVNKRTGTPWVAILAVGVLSVVGPWLPSSFLIVIMSVTAFAFIIGVVMVALSCWRLRVTHPDMPRPYKVPGGMVTIGAAALISVALLALLVVPASPGYLNAQAWSIVGTWAALGLVVFVTRLSAIRRSGFADASLEITTAFLRQENTSDSSAPSKE